MDKFHSSKSVRKNMAEHGLKFQKSLGQNFLTDASVLSQIVSAADLDKDSCVLEIGPGAGALTRELASVAGKVVSVEIDKNLIPLLTENTAEFDNVTIINEDILKVDLEKLFSEQFGGKPVKVVANLPYYITTPIIMKLLEEKPGIESIVIMIQKEVAERLLAEAGSKAYGAVTVSVNYYAKPSAVCLVPPEAFVPPPKVWSEVLKLDVLDEPPVQIKDETHFFNLVKAAFGQRRKTFLNSASNFPALTAGKEDIRKVLLSLGFPETIRGESFSISDFAAISNALLEQN